MLENFTNDHKNSVKHAAFLVKSIKKEKYLERNIVNLISLRKYQKLWPYFIVLRTFSKLRTSLCISLFCDFADHVGTQYVTIL